MLPLNQGRFVTGVVPDSVCKTVKLSRIEARHPGLFLDCHEEFVLVDFTVKLPERLLAFVVMDLRRTIARYLIEFIVLVWRSRQVCFLEIDVLFHEDSWTRRQEVWTSLWIPRQFEEVDL